MKFIKGAILGVVLGTVGAYLFNPTTGKKNRDKAQQVAKQLTAKLKVELEALEKITKKEYNAIIKKVVGDLKEDTSLSKESWAAIIKELQARWKNLSAEVKTKAKKS